MASNTAHVTLPEHCVTTEILVHCTSSVRDLNTVGAKSATESTSEVMEGSCPRPNQGRVRNYGTQGRHEYGRLGGPRLCLNYLNSDTNLNTLP